MKSYGIGEVCRLLDIKPHVLRYWETVVDLLTPDKSVGGRRHYGESDLRLLYRLKHLVFDKGLSPESAGKVVWEERTGSAASVQVVSESIRDTLVSLRERFAAEDKQRATTMPRIRRFGRPDGFVGRAEVPGYRYLDAEFLSDLITRIPCLDADPQPASWEAVKRVTPDAIARACGLGRVVDGTPARDDADDAVAYTLCSTGVVYVLAVREWNKRVSAFVTSIHEASLRAGTVPSVYLYAPPWASPCINTAARRFPRGLVHVLSAPVLPLTLDGCPVVDGNGRLLVSTSRDAILAVAIAGRGAPAGGSVLYAPETAVIDQPARMAAQIAEHLVRQPSGPTLFCRRLSQPGLFFLTGSTVVGRDCSSIFRKALALAPAPPDLLKPDMLKPHFLKSESSVDDTIDTAGKRYLLFRAVLNRRCDDGAVLVEEGLP